MSMLVPGFPSPRRPAPRRFRGGRLAAVALASALVLCAGAPAWAATVRAMDLIALVARAELIVVGQPRERQSRWANTGTANKLIVTDVSIRVRESLKGTASPDADIVVTHLGGQMDGLGLKVPGSAAFKLGAVAVIFLRAHPGTGEWRTVGMSQGVLPVELADGVQTVRPGGAGAALMRADADGILRHAPGALAAPVPLSDFTANVRRIVLEQRAQ